jgi:hypothetical protein
MNPGEKNDGYAEDALNSLDGVERAVPRAYLLTRIQARLSRQEITLWEKAVSFISKPAIAIPGLMLILVLNTMAIVNYNTGTRDTTAEQVVQVPADDYSVTVATIYESENP